MAPPIRPRRSVLFLPGANERALARAATLAADVLVFDLEDSVPPEKKADARAMVAGALVERDYGPRERIVRINGLETPWAAGDIAAIIPVAPDGILVPKVSRPEDLRRIRAALRAASASPSVAIWAMIETPLSVLNAGAIAAAGDAESAPLAALIVGTNDLAAETGMRPEPDRLSILPLLTTCIVAARAYDLAVIDGIYSNYNDAEGFAAECTQAARILGMDGKSLIHPSQVDPCNEAFTPPADEIAWARAIVAAFERQENDGRHAVLVGGRMVERVYFRAARRLLAATGEPADLASPDAAET